MLIPFVLTVLLVAGKKEKGGFKDIVVEVYLLSFQGVPPCLLRAWEQHRNVIYAEDLTEFQGFIRKRKTERRTRRVIPTRIISSRVILPRSTPSWSTYKGLQVGFQAGPAVQRFQVIQQVLNLIFIEPAIHHGQVLLCRLYELVLISHLCIPAS